MTIKNQDEKCIELLSTDLIRIEVANCLFKFVYDEVKNKNFIRTYTFIFHPINQLLKEIQIIKQEDIIFSKQNQK